MNTDTFSRGEIVLYQTADGRTSIDVKLENETAWLSKEQMAMLFERDGQLFPDTSRTFLKKENSTRKWYVQNLHTPLHMAR